jgi:hypothetical protein
VRTGAAFAANASTAHAEQPTTAFFLLFLLCDVPRLLTVLAVPVAPYPAGQTHRPLSLSSAPVAHAVQVNEGLRPLALKRVQRVQAASPLLLHALPVRVLVVVVVVVDGAVEWTKRRGEGLWSKVRVRRRAREEEDGAPPGEQRVTAGRCW